MTSTDDAFEGHCNALVSTLLEQKILESGTLWIQCFHLAGKL